MTSLNSPPEETLYRRLGGYDVIAAVVDEFMSRFGVIPGLRGSVRGEVWTPIGAPRQLLVDQICSLAGGPCVYIGRDMKTAHAGLGITEAEWQANMEYASAALEEYCVALKEKEEFLAIFQEYKDDIVEKS